MKFNFPKQYFRVALLIIVVIAGGLIAMFTTSDSPVVAFAMSPFQDKALTPLKTPPEDQTYIGSKQCSACHFDQYMTWRQTKHAKALEILPAKYKEDASCLECHTTGFGKPTGYKDATSLGLEGTSCEACHGPGSKHAEISKEFANKKLTDEQSLYVRSTIHKLLPDNSCVKCHKSKGHVPHPEFDKE